MTVLELLNAIEIDGKIKLKKPDLKSGNANWLGEEYSISSYNIPQHLKNEEIQYLYASNDELIIKI